MNMDLVCNGQMDCSQTQSSSLYGNLEEAFSR